MYEVRASGEIRAKDDGRITGHAAVFDQPTMIGSLVEVIKPGAFTRSIEKGIEVKALWNHNPDIVLGSTGAGTLRLSEDDIGLALELDPPTSAAQYVESITRGDVSKMSFGFQVAPGGETFTDGMRELTDLTLFDVSPVAYPAYTGTDITVRSRVQAMLQGVGDATAIEALLEELVARLPDTRHGAELAAIAGTIGTTTDDGGLMVPDAALPALYNSLQRAKVRLALADLP